MFKLALYFVLTLFGEAFGQEKRVDVCGVSQTLYDDGGRNVACRQGRKHYVCDRDLANQWYKVVTNSDTDPTYKTVNMPTVCPEMEQCGAITPIWLNGSLPSASEDVVKLTGCMRGMAGCCERTFPIYVKNCTSFIAYFFEGTPDCSTRYCFGNSEECPHAISTPKPDEGQNIHGDRDLTTRSYWERSTQRWWDRTTRPYWERSTQPWWDRTTRPYWERSTQRWWDRTTRPYWERSTQPWWDRTTRPYWERSTQPWWDRTTRPYWERSTQRWWDRTTRPYWERTTKPWWDRTTRPYWERTTKPWWDRTTRPYWERTTKPWWDRTNRPYWERTTKPWWERSTQPWWYSTTFGPSPEESWERRYRHLLNVSRRNTILSGVTLLLVANTIVIVAVMALCKCRKKRRNNYAMFQPALIDGTFKV